MMRAILALAALAALASVSLPAYAGTATGKVAAIHVDGSHVILSLGAWVAPRVACNVGNGFAADAKTALGQAASQTLTAVENAALVVTATGTGSCTILPGFEDLVSLKITATSSDNHK